MTNLIIPTYDATLLDESCKFLILSQKEYALKLGIPWGMSESSYNLKDFEGNYQYKTFGIPWLGIKRGLESEIVVSPYSTALALTEYPKDAINNLKRLEKEGALGKYGFYDAIDYTQSKQVIKTFMAHHEGMILSAIDNQLKNNIFQKRFMNNPEIEGTKILLQETMPTNIILTKEKKEKTQKIKYKNIEDYSTRNTGLNVISTNRYSSVTYENGCEYNKLDDILLTDENNIYIKDIDSKKVWSFVNSKKETDFTPYSSEFKLNTGYFKTNVNTTIAPDLEVEVKEINITNRGLNDLNLEITVAAKPIMVTKRQYDSQPAFENMFLNFENVDDYLVVSRNKRMDNEQSPYLITSLFSEEGGTEFEIDKEKFVDRKNNKVPDSVLKSYPFSKKEGNVINPIIAMRKIISIKPSETKKVYLISSADYDKDIAIKNFIEYRNIKNLDRLLELSRVQTEAEIRYLGLKNKEIQTYQKMLKFLLLPNNITVEKEYNIKNLSIDISNEKIWKYGISGDFPILLVNIKDLNDYYVVKEVFKAYEFFRSRNIKVEVAITSKKDILENIRNDNMERYLNQREGIFVLNDLSREERKVFELRASLIIDAHNGSLKKQIDELDDSIGTEIFEDIKVDNLENASSLQVVNDRKNVLENANNRSNNLEGAEDKNNVLENVEDSDKDLDNKIILNSEDNEVLEEDNDLIVKTKDLKLYNGYGGFNGDGSEYYIIQGRNKRLPLAWSNILANKNFGSVVTDSLRRIYMV